MTTLKLSELLRYRFGNDVLTAPAGGYVHRQNIPSAFWVVNHNLGQRYVVVEVIRDDDLANTGRYDFPTIDFVDNNTLTVAFNYVTTGRVAVAAGSVKGEKGDIGNIVVAGSYIHDQPDADTVWNIQHNLGHKYVTVELIDEYDTVITGRYNHPTITYIDENNLFAAFDYSVAGKAVATIGSGGNIQIESGSNVFLGSADLSGTTIGNVINNVFTDYSNVNVAAYLSSQSITSANIGAFQTYTNLTFSTIANAASQTVEINALRANITAANSAITGLTSNAAIQASILDTLTGNASTQSQLLDSLTSNAAIQATTLNTLLSNAVAQQTSLIDLVANAAAQAEAIANAAGTYGNANVAAYLPTYTGNIAGNIVKNGYTWTFGTDGNLTLPETGYLQVGTGIVAGFASSPAPVISGFSSISAENFRFQGNGVNILSTVGAGAYGNTQVASYLLNFDGDIEFTSSTAKIGNVDVITVMDSIRSPAYQFSNGVSIFDGITGTYSNTNVAAYLTTGVTTANLTATGNVVQQSAYYETYGNISNTGGNLTCNFNLGTTFYAALTANVTANFTNVNAIASTVSGATIIVDQGATAYRIANVQVNGVNQTVRWVGAVAGAGTASNTDIVSFSLIHLGGGAYRVLGQQSSYG
jgi:hypothetical protein